MPDSPLASSAGCPRGEPIGGHTFFWRTNMRRRWLPIVAALLIFPAAGLTWHLARGPSPAWHSASPAAAQSIPATISTAERKDVPVYLTGLGTVQAFNSVTVKV